MNWHWFWMRVISIIKYVIMNKEIKELLEEIQEWMIENDYECGEHGNEIYQKILTILKYDNNIKN